MIKSALPKSRLDRICALIRTAQRDEHAATVKLCVAMMSLSRNTVEASGSFSPDHKLVAESHHYVLNPRAPIRFDEWQLRGKILLIEALQP